MIRPTIMALGAFGFSLLSQAIPKDLSPGFDLSSMTATSILGFYAVWVTTKTLPTMEANHRADMMAALSRIDTLVTKITEVNAKAVETNGRNIEVISEVARTNALAIQRITEGK